MKSLFALSMASPNSAPFSSTKSLSFSAPFPNSSLSSLSFPKKSHFPICCSMSDHERLVARKKDQAHKFYKKEKIHFISSEEKKKLLTKWIHENMVVEDKDKKVKNKLMKKKKHEDLEEIDFGDILEKGKSALITFMLCAIKVLPVEEEKKEDKKDEEEKLKKKLEEIEKLKKKLEDEEKMRKAKEEEEEQRKKEEYEKFFEEEKAKKEMEKQREEEEFEEEQAKEEAEKKAKEEEKKAMEDLLCAALVLGALMKHLL